MWIWDLWRQQTNATWSLSPTNDINDTKKVTYFLLITFDYFFLWLLTFVWVLMLVFCLSFLLSLMIIFLWLFLIEFWLSLIHLSCSLIFELFVHHLCHHLLLSSLLSSKHLWIIFTMKPCFYNLPLLEREFGLGFRALHV